MGFADEFHDGVIPWSVACISFLICILFILKHSAKRNRAHPLFATVLHSSGHHETLSYHATREGVAWGLVTLLLFVSLGLAVYVTTELTSGYKAYFDTVPAEATAGLKCVGNPKAFDAVGNRVTSDCLFTGDYRTGYGVSEEEVEEMCNARTDCGGYHVTHHFPYATSCECSNTDLSPPSSPAPAETCPNCVSVVGAGNGAPVYRLLPQNPKLQVVDETVVGSDREARVVTYIK